MKRLLFGLVHRKNVCAAVLLFLVCGAFFAKLFFPNPKIFATAEIGISDIWYLNFPLKNFLGESLKAGRLPVWDPLRNSGFPDLAEGQIGTFNLYNLLAFRLLPTITAFNLGFIVMFFLCGLGMYLFTFQRGFPPSIAFYVAFIYSFSGFFITHISHYPLLQTMTFFPLLMFALDLLLSQITIISVVFLSLVLSQQIFSGFPQMVFISGIGLVLYCVFKYIRHETKLINLVLFLIALVLGLVLSAAQVLPTLELIPISQRATGLPTQELLFYKFPLKHLLGFINPFAFGNPQQGSYPHFKDFDGSLFWENTGYIGIIPLMLSAVAILTLRRFKKEGYFYVFLAGLSTLLMLGGGGPLYFLLTLPPFSFFRFSSRYLLLFVFALVMLSGYGLKQLLAFYKKKSHRQITLLLIILLSMFDILHIWYNYHPTVKYSDFMSQPVTAKTIKSESHGNMYTYLQNAYAWDEFFKTGSSRPERYLELRNELAPNLNLLFNVATADSYASSLTPKRLAYYNALLSSTYKVSTTSAYLDIQTQRLLNIRNTTEILSPVLLTNPTLRLISTYQYQTLPIKNNLHHYYNTEATPKYYAVNKFRVVDTVEDFLKDLTADTFDPKKEVILEHKPAVTPTENLEWHILSKTEETDRSTFKIVTNQPAIFVVTNSYYPGWQAEIDGKITEVFPANFVNLGIVIPKGSHELAFFFRSKSLTLGLIISLTTYAGVFIYVLRWLFKRR